MFSHTVTYKDFNDVEHNETLHFHLLAPQFADLEFDTNFGGSMSEFIKQIMRSEDGQKIYAFFQLLIAQSYGRRSADGATFSKNPEWTKEFLQSLPYEEFFMWLLEDPKNAEAFWMGIIPKKIMDRMAEVEKNAPGKKKFEEMTKEELVEAMRLTIEAKGAAQTGS